MNEYELNVTQATVSRDIKELQLIKVPTPTGQYVYSLPNDRKYHPLEKLGRYLMDSFVNIDGTGNLLVLKTLPGNAQSIGAILDQIDWDEVLGTICGDDTCLIICRDEEAVKQSRHVSLIYYNFKEVSKHATNFINKTICNY